MGRRRVFVFAGTGPASVAAFADAVRALSARSRGRAAGVLWVTDPNLPPPNCGSPGSGCTRRRLTGGLLSALTTVPFRNYAVLADGDLRVRLDEAAGAVVIQQGAAAGDIPLDNDHDGATELPLVPGPLSVPLGGGPTAGCLVFDVQAPIGPDGPGHLEALDVGRRVPTTTPSWPGCRGPGVRAFPRCSTPAVPAAGPGAAATLDLGVCPRPGRAPRPGPDVPGLHRFRPLRSTTGRTSGPWSTPPIDVRLFRSASGRRSWRRRRRPTLYLVRTHVHPHPSGGEPAPALMWRPRGGRVRRARADAAAILVRGRPGVRAELRSGRDDGPAALGPRLVGPVSTAWAALTAPDPLVYFGSRRVPPLLGSGTPAPAAGAARRVPLPFFGDPAATLPRRDDPAAGTDVPARADGRADR